MSIDDNIVKIAKQCHEANKRYCETLGDYSQKSWEEAEEHQRKSSVSGVLFVIENNFPNPKDTHENWKTNKINDGWVYGTKKNVELKTHPCIVDYTDLPATERIKDSLFSNVVYFNYVLGMSVVYNTQ